MTQQFDDDVTVPISSGVGDLEGFGEDGDGEDFGEDDSTAAEQGNREGDEMVSEGDDPAEVAALDGDTQDIDAVGGLAPDDSDRAVGLDGTDDGEDPLSGEARG